MNNTKHKKPEGISQIQVIVVENSPTIHRNSFFPNETISIMFLASSKFIFIQFMHVKKCKTCKLPKLPKMEREFASIKILFLFEMSFQNVTEYSNFGIFSVLVIGLFRLVKTVTGWLLFLKFVAYFRLFQTGFIQSCYSNSEFEN